MGFKIYVNKELRGSTKEVTHIMISNDNKTKGSLTGCVIKSPNSTGYYDGWRRDFFKEVDEVEIDIPRSDLIDGNKLYVQTDKIDANDLSSCIVDFENKELITDEDIIRGILKKRRSTVTLKLKSNK